MTATETIPSPAFDDMFTADPLADSLWSSWLGGERYEAVRPHIARLGRHGGMAGPLAARAERNPPTLVQYDDRGERIDRVVYHPDYHRLEELSYGAGIVALKFDSEFLAQHREARHLIGFAGGYYFGQNESGLYCPICMTDGVGRVLERHGSGPEAEETLERIASTDLARLWQGAMFLTEAQGGSDVGANRVEAVREGDRWLLSGDKWFCSNVDAEACLVLARMPDGQAGTRGLGLFLLLRERPEGNSGRIHINRLKDKFGTRSMPTGEVTLERAEATLIGGAGEGFKIMAEMINLSRTYNAVASVAAVRRGVLEAAAYGAERRAFGSLLRDLPLWRATMADLIAEQLGSLVAVFETAHVLDRADCGDAEAERLVRALTPICKSMTAKQAVSSVSEAMEAIGGNAYIETSPMPRLLRDAQVLPIWEGTTNICTLDVLRSFDRMKAHEALFARIERAIEVGRGVDADLASTLQVRFTDAATKLAAIGGADMQARQRLTRGWVESAWQLLRGALLLERAAEPGLDEACVAACRRVLARPNCTAPAGAWQAAELAETEEPLLRAAYDPGS